MFCPADWAQCWDASGCPPDLEGVLAHSPQNSSAMHSRIASALLAKESVSLIRLANHLPRHSMAKLKVLPRPLVQPKRCVLRCGLDLSFCSRCSLCPAFTVCCPIGTTQTDCVCETAALLTNVCRIPSTRLIALGILRDLSGRRCCGGGRTRFRFGSEKEKRTCQVTCVPR